MKKLVGYFHIVLNFVKMTINDEMGLAMGIKTLGDPDVTFVSYTDVQLKALAQTVMTDLAGKLTDPHPTLTAIEQGDVNALSVAIMAVKGDVERQANAKAKGNRAIFDTIVNRIGFHSGKPHGKHIRIAEFLPSEKGSFHFRTPAEGKQGEHVIVVFQYGATLAENVIPSVWEQLVPLPYTELIVSGIPSGTIIALWYAVQLSSLTGKRGKKPISSTAATEKEITTPSSVSMRLPVNKQGKISLVYHTNYLHFSDVMYYRIP
jgi:hypothetical protein